MSIERTAAMMAELNRAENTRRIDRYRRLMAARHEIEGMFGAEVEIMTDINGHISFERRTPEPSPPLPS